MMLDVMIIKGLTMLKASKMKKNKNKKKHVSLKRREFLFFRSLFHFYSRVLLSPVGIVIRSYHGESTASHPNCEVKHRWARSVLW